MRERADELGGTIIVEAADGGGTRVVARLPLETAPQQAPHYPAALDPVDPDQASLPAPEGHRA